MTNPTIHHQKSRRHLHRHRFDLHFWSHQPRTRRRTLLLLLIQFHFPQNMSRRSRKLLLLNNNNNNKPSIRWRPLIRYPECFLHVRNRTEMTWQFSNRWVSRARVTKSGLDLPNESISNQKYKLIRVLFGVFSVHCLIQHLSPHSSDNASSIFRSLLMRLKSPQKLLPLISLLIR